jgi:spore maturation protein SpmA/spore maturation protein SpmB
MLNAIWLFLILAGLAIAGIQGTVEEATTAALKGCETAVTLAIGLIGIMALWLGLMRLAEKAGLVTQLARFLRPVMRRLFPDVPVEHPAMGSMLMNIAANMLGLANAATPLGLRAMRDLESLNKHPGTATNAMCTFLAINTSSVQLIPATAIAVLAAAKSVQPTVIVGTAFVATLCSTVVGITAVKLLEKLPMFRLPKSEPGAASEAKRETETLEPETAAIAPPPLAGWKKIAIVAFCLGIGLLVFDAVTALSSGTSYSLPIRFVNAISLIAVPALLGFFPLVAALRGVPVYEEFVQGAREGFDTAVRIIPFLVAMLAAIGFFRGAGGIDLITAKIGSALGAIGFHSELLPLVLMRPLSGSGSMGIFAELVQTYGADHIISRTAATILGSTETTLYVVTVYFGSVVVRRTRHAIPAGLLADLAGVIAAVTVCNVVFR